MKLINRLTYIPTLKILGYLIFYYVNTMEFGKIYNRLTLVCQDWRDYISKMPYCHRHQLTVYNSKSLLKSTHNRKYTVSLNSSTLDLLRNNNRFLPFIDKLYLSDFILKLLKKPNQNNIQTISTKNDTSQPKTILETLESLFYKRNNIFQYLFGSPDFDLKYEFKVLKTLVFTFGMDMDFSDYVSIFRKYIVKTIQVESNSPGIPYKRIRNLECCLEISSLSKLILREISIHQDSLVFLTGEKSNITHLSLESLNIYDIDIRINAFDIFENMIGNKSIQTLRIRSSPRVNIKIHSVIEYLNSSTTIKELKMDIGIMVLNENSFPYIPITNQSLQLLELESASTYQFYQLWIQKSGFRELSIQGTFDPCHFEYHHMSYLTSLNLFIKDHHSLIQPILEIVKLNSRILHTLVISCKPMKRGYQSADSKTSDSNILLQDLLQPLQCNTSLTNLTLKASVKQSSLISFFLMSHVSIRHLFIDTIIDCNYIDMLPSLCQNRSLNSLVIDKKQFSLHISVEKRKKKTSVSLNPIQFKRVLI
ncbi:hypothetical protein DLAC_05953 [Tieghemostelium lacteum]|uniref:Uncharacterized protein n=1 Tax=Tieghemostelium lacteum TaxID=361077 RepID=A0A151ZHA5_TIELA|nr:hypothetical protein DLAC_05953 [Tieghemostelium lacteum]|eukprot:KYQ93289.1 hypothetical protein DLAC_05953 [Tieghemostelium lacteum]